jgi:polyribonucleotide nucleotidyltransferase
MKIVEREIQGKVISIETGRVAKQASGSVIVRQGDTMVLVTAVGGNAKVGDFLPLTVDYVEKTYAAGKIPGGFFRREGKMSERETLISRLIDRPCRPLFPEGFNHEIQVMATVISVDGENDPDVLSVCGASAALTLSELPFEGPIAGVRVGRINGKFIINPTKSELTQSDLDFIVAGSKDAIVMVEGEAEQVPEADVVEALFFAHKELQAIIAMQEELQKQAGKPKMTWSATEERSQLIEQVRGVASEKLKGALKIKEKLARRTAVKAARDETVLAIVKSEDPDAAELTKSVASIFETVQYDVLRKMALTDGMRVDGRDKKTVRPISIETGILPRTHGSALFTRGETQALVIATLGTKQEAQRLDSLMGEESKTFMLHYNFPAYSVNECKPLRGPGRREIGHGFLAERAVTRVLPTEKDFPYVVRVVSEVTESNGSSSMATVCGTSLALMDAGVPVTGPVAGVAMGLISEGDRYIILTDILGDEDALGDMDFKVCGTEKGICALQMDIKIKGLKRAVVEEAMAQAREGRIHIIQQMTAVISGARTELSQFAPRILKVKVKPERVKDVIGPGGKMIRAITEEYGVKIDVEDDGTVSIFATDPARGEAAMKFIKGLTEEAEVGRIYTGTVKKIMDFGAFVEILPGTQGLLHISQIANERVEQVTDVLQEGDEVMVKVLGVEPGSGKIRLSRREALNELAARA